MSDCHNNGRHHLYHFDKRNQLLTIRYSHFNKENHRHFILSDETTYSSYTKYHFAKQTHLWIFSHKEERNTALVAVWRVNKCIVFFIASLGHCDFYLDRKFTDNVKWRSRSYGHILQFYCSGADRFKVRNYNFLLSIVLLDVRSSNWCVLAKSETRIFQRRCMMCGDF